MDGTRTYFFYSDEGLVAEYDESGNELRSYGYQPDSTWTSDPLWLKEGGEYYWYQNDHLGTPQKLIDMNGTVVWSATYTAFGGAQVQVETVTNNLRFPGQYEDAETGLYYNWFRYYDPGIGRYLMVDPLHDAINWYAYVFNNPVMWSDPTGLLTAGDIANAFDRRVDESIAGLSELTAESTNPAAHVGAASFQLAVAVAAGFVDMLRLGEGVVEGGWGYGKDALRLGGFLAAGTKALQAARGGTATVCGIAEAAETGVNLSGKAKQLLGGLQNLKDVRAGDAILLRGGKGKLVKEIGYLANKLVGDLANMAAQGGGSAATAIKIIKNAARISGKTRLR